VSIHFEVINLFILSSVNNWCAHLWPNIRLNRVLPAIIKTHVLHTKGCTFNFLYWNTFYTSLYKFTNAIFLVCKTIFFKHLASFAVQCSIKNHIKTTHMKPTKNLSKGGNMYSILLTAKPRLYSLTLMLEMQCTVPQNFKLRPMR